MTGAAPVRAPHAIAIGLFLLVWLSCSWFGSQEFNPNNSTRLFAAISLVEQGDATIDEFQALTIDKAKIGDHYYTDKSPGMTLMAVPSVWIADRLTGDSARRNPIDLASSRFENYLKLRMRLTVATTVAVLIAFAAVLLFDLATGVTGSVKAGLVAALGYATATPAWGWSTTIFGHAPVGALLLIATWAVWRGTSGVRELGRWRYPLMFGAALGWAIVIELQTVLPGVAVGLWAIWRTRSLSWPLRFRLAALTALAGLAALTPMLVYNEIAFATPFKVGYQGVVGFDGMQQGLFGLTYPHFDVLVQLLAGPDRGLVFVAPVLLLAPFGLARLIRAPATRDLGWLALAVTVIVLLYNASYYYWDGGYSTGPRHSIPAMGFLALGLAPLWRAWGGTARRLIAGLLGLSMAINLAIAAAEVTAPHGYPFPLYDPVITRFLAGQIRTVPSEWWRWGTGFGLALYLTLALPILWFLFRAAGLSDRDEQNSLAPVA
ncbi:hypothetical protein [Sphingomonas sp. ERG5]|uniref:hypothetical protein n=1 Tax=Sphingomonas sp. ERG5 TaxID=1381597 RepID=UPI0006917281|nr:hypothetical protein [Sphingomonas sp. ERG5]